MEHFHKKIQGWSSFTPWYKEAVQAASTDRPSIFVELGTWKGKSAAFMAVEIANSGKPIRFYTVDTFQGSDEPAHHADPIIQAGKLEEVALANLHSVAPKYVRIIKSDSTQFASKFEDGSVDFIFIDAGHTYEYVTADIDAWWPKLKSSGIMAGDDFTWSGVFSAVRNAFFIEVDKADPHCPPLEGRYARQIKPEGWVFSKFGVRGDKCWRVMKA